MIDDDDDGEDRNCQPSLITSRSTTVFFFITLRPTGSTRKESRNSSKTKFGCFFCFIHLHAHITSFFFFSFFFFFLGEKGIFFFFFVVGIEDASVKKKKKEKK